MENLINELENVEHYDDLNSTQNKIIIKLRENYEESDNFKGIETLIRVKTIHGKKNGYFNEAVGDGAKFECYGLKSNKIYKLPYFAYDHRVLDKIGNENVKKFSLEDKISLKKDEELHEKRTANATFHFRNSFPEKTKQYDKKWGIDGWYATGDSKLGYVAHFGNFVK